MKNKFYIFAAAAFILFASPVIAQGNFPLIQKLAWLEGTYQGEKWDGFSEEIWSAPSGNHIIGTYRYMKEGKVVFTELVYITEHDNTLTLRIKHFGNDFAGWEEKGETLDFPLLEVKDNEVIFDGLTMKKTGEGTYRSTVKIKDKKNRGNTGGGIPVRQSKVAAT